MRLRSGDRDLGPVEVATTAGARMRGLIGQPSVGTALWLRPASAVHTIGMRVPIDVVYLDREGVVLAITTMRPHRLGRVVFRARSVLEMAAGAAADLAISVGDTLHLVGDSPPFVDDGGDEREVPPASVAFGRYPTR